MKVKHVFGGHIYLISNFGVARNPIFIDKADVQFFKDNIEKYLGEICDVYAYSHKANQFQYLVRIKDRNAMEAFFYSKQKSKQKNESHAIYDKGALIPPDSYLIFSQEVSNCLNSYAKKFNFKYNRKGGLFGDRYSKHLVESEDEMDIWIDRLNIMKDLVIFSTKWLIKEDVDLGEKEELCSSLYYSQNACSSIHRTFSNFRHWSKKHLRGCFKCLPPASINAQDFFEKFHFFKNKRGYPPPW